MGVLQRVARSSRSITRRVAIRRLCPGLQINVTGKDTRRWLFFGSCSLDGSSAMKTEGHQQDETNVCATCGAHVALASLSHVVRALVVRTIVRDDGSRCASRVDHDRYLGRRCALTMMLTCRWASGSGGRSIAGSRVHGYSDE